MKILVTGGFGFIGSWLTERLLFEGDEVYVVDDMRSAVIRAEDIVHDNLHHYCMSISEYFTHWNSFTPYTVDFDVIYHLASPVGPAGILDHYGDIVNQVVSDSTIVLRMAMGRFNTKLVYVSTSEVYGGGNNGLCAEDMPKVIQSETTVRLEYAVAKLAMEIAIQNNRHCGFLDAVIVRPFNVVGPRQSDKGGFVLPRFIKQAMAGEALTVFGDGSQVRAFTHVRDIVDGLILAEQRGKSGEVYNLGNERNRTTVMQLARLVNEVVGNTAGVQLVDPKDIYGPLYAEAADKYPDATKAQNELGWFARNDLARTVAETVNSMREVKV